MLVFEIEVELHGDFVYVVALALVLLPHMLQIAAGDECQVVVAYHLARVAYHAASASSILHEVQLHNLMTMDGVVKLFLMAVSHVHKVMFAQRCNLMQHF